MNTEVPSYGLFNWFKGKVLDKAAQSARPENIASAISPVGGNYGGGSGGGIFTKIKNDVLGFNKNQPVISPVGGNYGGNGGIFNFFKKRNEDIFGIGKGMQSADRNWLTGEKLKPAPAPQPAPTPAPAPAQKSYRDFDWSDYNANRATMDYDERDQYYDNYKRDKDFWGSYYNIQPSMGQPLSPYGGGMPNPYATRPSGNYVTDRGGMSYTDMDTGINYNYGMGPRFQDQRMRNDRIRSMAMGRFGQPMSSLYDYNQPNYGAYVNPDGSEKEGGKLMDIQDRDNDGYDDRYQLGPGHVPGTEYKAEADPIYEPRPQPRPTFGGGGFLGQLLGGLLGNLGGMASRLTPSPFSQPLGGLFNRQQSVQPPRKRNFGGLSSLFAKMF